MRLDGEVAIVTGAGSGIGRAVALRLAEEGAEAVIAEIDEERGHNVEEECRAATGRGLFVRTDVTSEQSIIDMTARALDAFGRIDVLVNNAGTNFVKPMLETTLEDWEGFMALDLRSVFLCSREALRTMVGQGRGSIINISSVHSIQTLPRLPLYATAKGGVSAMTRAMAIDFGPQGVRINAVCPGITRTPIYERLKANAANPEAYEHHWVANTPLQRVQEPEEVASVCAFLASDDSSFVTGTELFTDGGMTAMLKHYPDF